MLKLKRYDEAVWFDYRPGVKLRIKPLSRYDHIQIRRLAAGKVAVKGISGPESIVEEVDQSLYMIGALKTCLLDWQGIEIEGIEKPTQRQMIEAVCQDEDLVSFILEKTKEISAAEDEKLKEEIKNSESSQNGSSNKIG